MLDAKGAHPRIFAAWVGPLQVLIDVDLVNSSRLVLKVCALRQT